MVSEQTLNKPEALRLVLQRHGLDDIDTEHDGNKKYSCPYPGHANGDKNKSLSVNYLDGVVHCFTCDMAGDAIQLLRDHEGLTYRDAVSVANGLVEANGGIVSPAAKRYSPTIPGLSRPGGRERGASGYVPSWLS